MTAITKEWYKLDNAAKIYPASVSKSNSGTFRVAVYLKEEIDPIRLQQAVEQTTKSFPTMAVTMKHGFFWYYLQPNNKVPIIESESQRPCERIESTDNNGFHFRVLYYNNKIALETFHVLTDGAGAITFLKAIIGLYLNIPILIIHDKNDLAEDSFKKYYKAYSGMKKRPKTLKAKQLAGKALPIEGVIAQHGIMSASKLKSIIKSKGTTITAYLTTMYVLSMYRHVDQFDDNRRPIIISVPINLRRRFPSVSMRNFSYFTNIAIDINEEQNFDSILSTVSKQLIAGTDPELLYSQFHSNVKIESNILFRLVPNILKNGILWFVKNIFSSNNFTSNFSNLGIIDIPDTMKPYVDYFEVTLNGASPFKINLAVCTYNDKLVASISRRIEDKLIVDEFFNLIAADIGVEIYRYSNEENDEV